MYLVFAFRNQVVQAAQKVTNIQEVFNVVEMKECLSFFLFMATMVEAEDGVRFFGQVTMKIGGEWGEAYGDPCFVMDPLRKRYMMDWRWRKCCLRRRGRDIWYNICSIWVVGGIMTGRGRGIMWRGSLSRGRNFGR